MINNKLTEKSLEEEIQILKEVELIRVFLVCLLGVCFFFPCRHILALSLERKEGRQKLSSILFALFKNKYIS